MKMIGTMQVRKADNGFLSARGNIKTIQTRITFLLERHREAGTREKAPTHTVVVKTVAASGEGSEYIPVGVAWQNEITRGDNMGKAMVTISLTDPSFPEWTRSIAAFPTGEKDEDGCDLYELTQSRKRSDAGQASEAA